MSFRYFCFLSLLFLRQVLTFESVADPGGRDNSGPVKISHKKMATKRGHIDFMFLGPSPTLPLDPLLFECMLITRMAQYVIDC